MSDLNTRMDQLERQMLIDRNATNVLLNRTDQIQSDFRAFQVTMNQQFANVQQDLHLIIEMFRTQQTQLDRQQSQLDHHQTLLERQQTLLERQQTLLERQQVQLDRIEAKLPGGEGE